MYLMIIIINFYEMYGLKIKKKVRGPESGVNGSQDQLMIFF